MAVAWVAGLAMSAAALDVDRAWQLEAPRRPVVEHAPGILWLEAENFDNYGGWLLDVQLAHKIVEGGTYDVAVVGGGAAGVFEIRCYG